MALDRKAVFGLLIGRMGGGKTWSLVRYLVDEWLPLHEGRFICNLPLNVEAICEYCERVHGLEPREVKERIHVIPEEVCNAWLAGQGSPPEYIDSLHAAEVAAAGYELAEGEELGIKHPLSKGLVCIDEAGDYFPSEPPKEQQEICRKTARWIAKVRHEGARVIFCCQNDMQICAPVRRLIGFQIHLTDLGEWIEPLTCVLVSDWFQVISKFVTRRPIQWVKEEECVGNGANLEVARTRWWLLHRRYFGLYNTRNKAGGRTGEAEGDQWIRFGVFKFIRWFVMRNLYGLGRALLVLVAVLVLIWPGKVLFHAGMWCYREANELIKETSSMKSALGGKETAAASKPGQETSPASGVTASNVAKDGSGKSENAAVSAEGAAAAGPIVVMITSENFVTKDGAYYEIGDLIGGQMVRRLDVLRGEVVLDRSVLRVGAGLHERESPPVVERAVVQRSLRQPERPNGTTASANPSSK